MASPILPVTSHVRPTVFLEGFFLSLTADSVNQIRSDYRSARARRRRSLRKTWHVWLRRCSKTRSRTSARSIT